MSSFKMFHSNAKFSDNFISILVGTYFGCCVVSREGKGTKGRDGKGRERKEEKRREGKRMCI